MTLGDQSFQIKAAEADRGRAFRKYLRPATSPRGGYSRGIGQSFARRQSLAAHIRSSSVTGTRMSVRNITPCISDRM